MVTRREVVEKRKYLFQEATKKVKFNKGDRRVYTPRLCVVCGRPLSSLILRENRYITAHQHVRLHLSTEIAVDTCLEVISCYRTLRQKGELIENVNGG